MEKNCGSDNSGFWYTAKDGKELSDIIYIQDSEMGRRKNPFLITAITRETLVVDGILCRKYYIIQPNRRKTDNGR